MPFATVFFGVKLPVRHNIEKVRQIIGPWCFLHAVQFVTGKQQFAGTVHTRVDTIRGAVVMKASEIFLTGGLNEEFKGGYHAPTSGEFLNSTSLH